MTKGQRAKIPVKANKTFKKPRPKSKPKPKSQSHRLTTVEKPQEGQVCNIIQKALIVLHNAVCNKCKDISAEVQESCYRVGNFHTRVLDFTLEVGIDGQNVECMDWQWEPTIPVHLVRTVYEESCYPEGAVTRS
ncbi:uncharacterized protein FFB20_12432 [Fusarium fujikuroi]|uniref:Uncharacterized protein n=2 Tax=Fusarium fujikuroi TaxID=5127 RepID=S0EBP2_GIBF5|nr:uncharacterized protein FFUJ_12173 [Fusarium fujikuroi IMI 58289]KLO84927.1 uncharacterized protein Y057_3822 [Fusarium fujikuroi]KLP15410.1 uncharacterized protein LW94_10068 [Fusarium fujikuroi]QGI67953.1 hypothetical protein CEK27_011924 [Fusarium fujikuroi]QGI85185.1 hypothetical protein CEK25_011914 [Fusarium fujikuroi]QGI98839.1 hypothetical protein CEK26_011908 [Fusarium fujikuroi]